MTYFEAIILGIVQGITEFLPISSSGHLVIAEELLGLKVEMYKSFDVAVHVGTLLAIIFYFWKDIVMLFKGFFALFKKSKKIDDNLKKYRSWVIYIILGTIPAVLVGIFLEDKIDEFFRNALRVAVMMIIIGAIFFLAEYVHKKVKGGKITLGKALIIGLAQAVALIPGVLRWGSTIAAGLFQGVKRETAARFSFLLGAPAIFGAGLYTSMKYLAGGEVFDLNIWTIVIGFLTSFIVGYLAVYWLMKYLKTHGLYVFGGYLILMGIFISFFAIL